MITAPSGAVYYEVSKCPLSGAYASVPDMTDLVIPDNAKNDFTTRTLERWLRVATSLINGHLGQRFTTPLKTVSDGIVWATCAIAYAGAAGKRGSDPEGHAEKHIDLSKHEAFDLIRAMQNYEITLDPGLINTEPAKVAVVVSDPPRGWNGPQRLGVPGYAGLPGGGRWGRR